MNLNYYIADVFTRELFQGAQIAVFPNAESLSDEQMALLAREMNLSETVFLSAIGDNPTELRMRVFNPFGEISFAGHPIIAAAFVLAESGQIELSSAITAIKLEQNVGMIDVNISSEEGKATFIQFTQKVSSILDRFAPTDEELARFLGIQQSELDHKKFAPRLVSCGFPYLIVPVWNYETVREAKFNYSAWSQSAAPQTAAQEMLLFSPKTPFQDADFNLRLLGPRIGINDDPPVGNAIPAFCSYLTSFDHIQKGTHAFAVDRGDANSRRSVLNIEMDNKREEQLTIRVGGNAVMFSQGTIHL